MNNTRRSLTPLVRRIVRFYRELIDTYAVNTPGEPFDLSPWKMRLATIEAERDRQRYAGTLTLLAKAKIPVAAAHRP